MSRFIGKFIGFTLGLSIGNLEGAIIGFIIGHLHDRSIEKQRANNKDDFFPDFQIDRQYKLPFAMSIIVLGAKCAKCDGSVSKEEIIAFQRTFRANKNYFNKIGALFNQARGSAEGYEPHAARLAQILNMQPDILEIILRNLFFIAKADSTSLANEEINFLRRVAIIFGFSEVDFVRIASNAGIYLKPVSPEPREKTAYDILGVPTTATNEIIKRTYRSLIRKYHPDKLQAANLPQQRIEEASEKMKIINAAYSKICKERKVK